MGAGYGGGVRGMLPYNLLKTDDDAMAFMLEFTGLGLSNGFRDVIGDRVAEFSFKDKTASVQWLDPEDAAPIIEGYGRLGGSAPYSLLEAFWSDDMIFLPGFRGRHGFSLNLINESHPFYDYPVAPLRRARTIAYEALEHYMHDAGPDENSEGKVMLLEGLIRDFEFCTTHKLLYHFGY